MKGKSAVGVVVLLLIALVGLYFLLPPRFTSARLEDAKEAQRRLDEMEAQAAAAAAQEDEETVSDPNVFKVEFECSNGTFVAEVHKDWAPLGATRIKELVEAGFYDGAKFFRVVPGSLVQFGLAADPEVTAQWSDRLLLDDPVAHSNVAGTISFAARGPDTRTTQLFVNLRDNTGYDGMGFAPVAEIVDGMVVAQSINPQYGEAPQGLQSQIRTEGNGVLDQLFPGLDYIISARIAE